MNNTWQIPLQNLDAAQRTLSEAYAELSRQIAVLESAINDRKLGVQAWVEEPIFRKTVTGHPEADIDVYDDIDVNYTYRLGYGKHDGDWGLLISVESDWKYDYEYLHPNVIFLRDASGEARMKALDRFPDLLECLMKKLTAAIADVTNNAELAKELAAALNRQPLNSQ